MEIAQIKEHVMNQVEPVFVMKGLREICVKVKKLIYKFTKVNVKLNEKLFSSEIPCPGGDTPCDGHGQCDLTSGECSCEAGRHGFDCSSKI